jgi:phosphohistidine phosphatase
MKLIFFRHGLAMDRSESVSKGIDEGDRPLLKEGKEKTRKSAELLRKLDFSIEEIVSSPFLRAVETAEVLKEACGVKGKISITEDLLPERNFNDFMSYLKNRSSMGECTVFVGHEPNLSHLVSSSLGGKKSFVEMKKSGFAVIEVESFQDLRAGNGKILTLAGPKLA